MTAPAPDRQELLHQEACFWDQQEQGIEALYARPHDWRFVPDIAERLIRPRVDLIERLVRRHRHEISSLIDIGCGNGWVCHAAAKLGIRSIGVDVSSKKIEAAKRLAVEQGLTELCEFHAADALELELERPVDLLTSHGSLHHFPDLERTLEIMVARFLRPSGLLLCVEPHFESMSPGTREFLLGWANSRWFGRTFDRELYLEVTRKETVEGPGRPLAAGELDIRSESPAGVQVFGEHVSIGELLKRHHTLLHEQYFHYLSGHWTNAFYVFNKPGWLRSLYRAALPAVVALDTALCRRPRFHRYAEEGLWFVRRR
jgi:SAM-dependent methyltransferase